MLSLLKSLGTNVRQKMSLRSQLESCFTELKESWSVFLTLFNILLFSKFSLHLRLERKMQKMSEWLLAEQKCH